MASRLRLIIVPGWRDSGPGHWQSLWAERLPGAVCLQQAGHINVDSGHGDWPLGLALLQSLAAEPGLAQAPAPSLASTSSTDSLETA